MRTLPTTIPPEIVDHILSFLHIDHTALETCSTVFPHIADRHLYSHITLRTPTVKVHCQSDHYYPVDPAKLLLLVGNERPHIVPCVLGVRIIISAMPPPAEHVALELLPVVSRILSILPQIRSIELSADSEFSWHALGFDFCRTFQKCLRLPRSKKSPYPE
jgi:hypothetical protein